MAVREIKTTLSLDGEKEFNRAISEAGRGMRVMASEMKAAAADFDVTGDEMEYLGRKSRSLNGQIEQQEKIIRALEGAVADSAQTYGDVSAKTDGYRIKLNNAYAALSRLKKEHEQTDKRMEELGRDSERTGRRLEQGIGEAADDVSRKFDGMVNKLDSDLGSIKAMTSISAVVDVAGTIGGAVKGAYEGVNSLVEGTADYNREIGKLKINAQNAGIEFEFVKDLAKDVAVITGDFDASLEGVNNLLGAGLNADELERVVNQLLGIVIKFPDTTKFETLSEELRKSIGEEGITGSLSEVLTTLLPNGTKDLELLNKAIANASKEGKGPKKTAVLSTLNDLGLEETLEKYRAEYEELIKYYEAQSKLTDAQARLGETMTPAATAGIEMVAGFVDKMTDMLIEAGKVVEKWQVAAEKGLLETSNDVEEARKNLSTEAWSPGITTDGSEAKEEGKTDAEDYNNGVGEYFEKNPIVVPGWDEFNPGIETGAAETGKNLARALGDAVEENAYYAVSKVNAMMASIESALNRKITYPSIGLPSPTSTTSYASAGTSKTTIALDGKKLGEATVAYNSAAMGESLIRAETYG